MNDNTPYSLGFGRDATGNPVIGAAGPAEVLDILIQLDGASWSNDGSRSDGQFVIVPGTRLNVMALEAVAVPNFVATEYRTWRSEVMASSPAWQAEVERMLNCDPIRPRALLPHQLDFLALLHGGGARSFINASEQGTGKSAVGWLALQLWGVKRALILCPKSLIPEWVRERNEVWPDDKPINCVPITADMSYKREDILAACRIAAEQKPIAAVLNYEMVHRLHDEIVRFDPDAIVMDESWRVKNHQAQVTKAALSLCDRTRHVLLLTGTPVGNHIGDLWAQLRALGREAMPENYYRFLNRYATMQTIQLGPRTVQKPVAIADAPGLMRRLEPYWYRATKAACLDLPPKVHRRVLLPMSSSTQCLTRAVKNTGEAALGNTLSLATEATVMLRLHQIAGGHRPVYNTETAAYELEGLDCPKIGWIKDFCDDVLVGNPSARCIIWATYTHELERITRIVNQHLKREGCAAAVQIWGGTKDTELESAKESFKSRSAEGVQVLVCQLRKMAFGHNLQEADYHVYFSNNWSYVVRSQSEDRSHRSGRADTVTYYDLILEGSVDEEVLAALDRKQDFSARIAVGTASEQFSNRA